MDDELFMFPNDETPKPIDKKLKRAQSLVGTSEGRPDKDFYPTPSYATEALLSAESFEGSILEPACGDGAISKVLIKNNFSVTSTDLVNRGYGQTPHDFLDSDYQWSADNIITNPPFNIAEKFIEMSLLRSKNKVAMLCKLQFLEGVKRRTMFETTPLKKVWVFSKRLSMARNGDSDKYSSGMLCFAWFIFEHGYVGEPTIGWL